MDGITRMLTEFYDHFDPNDTLLIIALPVLLLYISLLLLLIVLPIGRIIALRASVQAALVHISSNIRNNITLSVLVLGICFWISMIQTNITQTKDKVIQLENTLHKLKEDTKSNKVDMIRHFDNEINGLAERFEKRRLELSNKLLSKMKNDDEIKEKHHTRMADHEEKANQLQNIIQKLNACVGELYDQMAQLETQFERLSEQRRNGSEGKTENTHQHEVARKTRKPTYLEMALNFGIGILSGKIGPNNLYSVLDGLFSRDSISERTED